MAAVSCGREGVRSLHRAWMSEAGLLDPLASESRA
jgi:hypothetical protein